jgi:hypothetical protein
VLALVAGISILTQFPFGTTPARAPLDLFSAQRALAHVPYIASQPHPAGSPAQAEVRGYLIRQLRDMGFEVETQETGKIANVVARLPGTDSTGSLLILTHYDSVMKGPGAADNGSGTAALLEAARALSSTPAPRNDLVLLFDDGEESPFIFAGTKAFIHSHPLMEGVKVAISLDTAVRGPVTVNETTDPNGRMVGLAGVHQGLWSWSSVSGGGNYDGSNFQNMDIQVLVLEDNYAFHEQHSPLDRTGVIKPASLQQMGDQALAVARALGDADLRESWGAQETYIFIPVLGLLHYPQAWTRPIAVTAAVLLIAALVFGLYKRMLTLRGMAVALATTLLSLGIAGAAAGFIWGKVPRWMGWKPSAFPDWPEVVAPNSGYVFAGFLILAMILAGAAYRWTRRLTRPMEYSLGVLVFFALASLFMAWSEPRAVIIMVWPVLLGALGWILGMAFARRQGPALRWPAILVTALFLVHFPALILSTYFSSGLNSIAIIIAVWAALLFALLPGIEEAAAQRSRA